MALPDQAGRLMQAPGTERTIRREGTGAVSSSFIRGGDAATSTPTMIREGSYCRWGSTTWLFAPVRIWPRSEVSARLRRKPSTPIPRAAHEVITAATITIGAARLHQIRIG